MKTPIEVKDIRKGDLIRFESEVSYSQLRNMEYTARRTGDGLEHYLNIPGNYYLLERPEPPFEPYWGMVIGNPVDVTSRAVYIPENTKKSHLGWMISDKNIYMGNEWAKQKLAQGWAVIEKPEGVK